MPDGKRNDPYGQFNFLVEIDGVVKGGFSEASGLTTDTNVIEYRDGNEITTVRKLPGLMKYNNIVLKRGFTKDRSLWEWRKKVIDGKTQRTGGAIVVRAWDQPQVRMRATLSGDQSRETQLDFPT